VRLLLARHGNTFDPGDPVVWAGSQNDLPLVAKGVEQARVLAGVLRDSQIIPKAIYCGPLRRTRNYADIIIQQLALFVLPQVDLRLNEIDYGDWTGRTQAEVAQQFGEAGMKSWEERSVWPECGNWGGSEAQTLTEVHAFAQELVKEYCDQDTVLIVSSNGRLRYFLDLVEGEWARRKENGTFKVKTGNLCQMDYFAGKFNVRFWDQKPAALNSN
jgi:broad specificity phosphatase PhoE